MGKGSAGLLGRGGVAPTAGGGLGLEGVATVEVLLGCACGGESVANGGHLLAMPAETFVRGTGTGGTPELFCELFGESEGSVGADIL